MKRLNKRAMTLVEVIVAVALLSIVSLAIFSSTLFVIRLYANGRSVYEKTIEMSNNIEKGTTPSNSGQLSFTVQGVMVTVNGKCYSQTETDGEHTYSLVEFKPN